MTRTILGPHYGDHYADCSLDRDHPGPCVHIEEPGGEKQGGPAAPSPSPRDPARLTDAQLDEIEEMTRHDITAALDLMLAEIRASRASPRENSATPDPEVSGTEYSRAVDALDRAREEGRREGIEEAAKVADAYRKESMAAVHIANEIRELRPGGLVSSFPPCRVSGGMHLVINGECECGWRSLSSRGETKGDR